jgi:hypothetical protein
MRISSRSLPWFAVRESRAEAARCDDILKGLEELFPEHKFIQNL